MHATRLRIRSGLLAGTALTLILTAPIDAVAEAQHSEALLFTLPARNNMPPKPAAAAMPVAAAMPAQAGAASALDTNSDPEIGNRIREIVTTDAFEQVVSRKSDRDAIASLYQARNFQPLWLGLGGPSARANDVLDHLKTIGADGLDPRDYPMPAVGVGHAQTQAEAEVKFTGMLLTYARHAMTGRVHFSRVSANIDYKLGFDAGEVLKKLVAAGDLAKTLAQLNPPHPGYRALKAKLAELRAQPEDGIGNRIARGAVLRHSRDSQGRETVMADARVPLLRERLGVAAEPNSDYNANLAAAVARFQKANGIYVSGQLNGPTVDALNGPSRTRRIDAVLASMERWRWMPRELGRSHVVLNIPDFDLRVYNNGSKVWQTRTVVGKPGHETPLLSETMKSISVNPTWNVPQSIVYNELLPIYETSDPQIFERQGIKMERARDGSIRVFQPPGERNALGQIRFNFPNKFLVYQHDTPDRHYFAQPRRAFSHGCMRVQDAMKYAEVLLAYAAPKDGTTADGIRRMLGGAEQQIDFGNPIPVHITYQTAFVDEAGTLQIRDDVYGLDRKLLSQLTGSERRIADIAIDRPADPNFQPTPEQGAKLRSAARGEAQSGGFRRLFR